MTSTVALNFYNVQLKMAHFNQTVKRNISCNIVEFNMSTQHVARFLLKLVQLINNEVWDKIKIQTTITHSSFHECTTSTLIS